MAIFYVKIPSKSDKTVTAAAAPAVFKSERHLLIHLLLPLPLWFPRTARGSRFPALVPAASFISKVSGRIIEPPENFKTV